MNATAQNKRYPALFLGLALLLSGVAIPAQAVYYIDAAATGTPEDGSSWANAFRTLTNATANLSSGAEFWVTGGTYLSPITGGMDMKANNFYGGFTSGMSALSQRDWAANPTILDGGGVGRVINKTITGLLMMDGFVIRNGTNSSLGGALSTSIGTSFIFNNCLFSNNLSGGSSGVIHANSSKTKHTFSNCTFVANGAGTSGGVISYGKTNCTGEFFNCVFVGNSAAGGTGGVISEGQTPTEFKFSNCVFSNNTASQSGGALRTQSTLLSIVNCDFVGNTAGISGGAIYLAGTVQNCSNLFQNCTFAGNSASGLSGTTGGGAIIEVPIATIRLESFISNCTFLGNSSSAPSAANGVGGAIRAGPTTGGTSVLNVANCIFWGNTSTGGGTNISLSAVSSLNLSYSDFNTNGNFISGGTKNFGLGITNTDPLFASASYPYDAHLKSMAGRWDPALSQWVTDAVSSPCIDAGDPASDYSLEPPNNGGQINLGRYGNTVYASKSGTAARSKGAIIIIR